MLEALRPGGRLLLKSRPDGPIVLDLRRWLPKEPVLHLLHCGSFAEAVDLLARKVVDIEDLIGDVHDLEAFEPILCQPVQDDSLKDFFRLSTG